MAIEAYSFGLYDCKIATWSAAQNWGSAIDVESINLYDVQFETVSGRLDGDDERTALHARIIGGRIRMRFGFRDLTVLSTLTGFTETDSSPDGKAITITNGNMPYFGVNGRIDHTEGSGAYEVFIPKCKLMEGFTLGGTFGQFVTPEIQAEFISDGAPYYFGRVITRTTAVAVAIPPTAIT